MIRKLNKSYSKNLIFVSAFILASSVTYLLISHYQQQAAAIEFKDKKPISYEQIYQPGVERLKKALLTRETLSNQEADKLFSDLSITNTIDLHVNESKAPSFPILPLMLIWGAFAIVGLVMINRKAHAEKELNPFFMKALGVVEYPVIFVDSGLEVIWQNEKSRQNSYDRQKLELIFDETIDGSEVELDSKKYSVLVTELNYKGAKHFLAHLMPKTRTVSDSQTTQTRLPGESNII